MKREKNEIEKSFSPSPTDPLGSWTGVPENTGEVPVQDADDL